MSLKGIETEVLDLDWEKVNYITKNIEPKEFFVEEAFFFPTDRNRTEDKSTELYAKKTGIRQWHSKDFPFVKECVPKHYFDKFGIKYDTAAVKINGMRPGMFSHPHIDRYNGFKQKANPDKEIKKDNRWENAKTECIKHFPNSNFWHYSLQLNTYKAILEKNYGKKIGKMCLVCLHPNNYNNSYLLYEVPDLSEELKNLFELRKKML